MPTYVVLLRYTEQGAKHVRKTVERARQNRTLMSQRGVNVTNVYWTQGHYDVVLTAEAADEQSMMRAVLRVIEGGNVTTETLRAFSETEMEAITESL